MARYSIVAVLLATSCAVAQTTSVMDMFILDSTPSSLLADLFHVIPDPNDHDTVMTYSISCSPSDADCNAESIYPAVVYHTQGSIWGGTTTARMDDSTTTWKCNLAEQDCVKNIKDANGKERVETTSLETCYIVAHSVPMLVTKGVEKLQPEWFNTMGVEEAKSARSGVLASMGCPSTTEATHTLVHSTTLSTGPITSSAASTTVVSESRASLTSFLSVTGTESQNSITATTGTISSLTTSSSGASGTFKGIFWLVAAPAIFVSFVWS